MAWTARHFAPDAAIVLVHALCIPEPPSFLGESLPQREQLTENARRGAEARLRELTPGLHARRVSAEVREGEPAAVIAAVAQESEADVIVVGAHGRHTGLSAFLGSTAQHLAANAALPILVARGLPDDAPRNVLVALGDGPSTERLLAWATFLARRFDAELALLHVVSGLYTGAVAIGATESERAHAVDRLAAATSRWLERQARICRESVARVGTIVAFGDPASEISATAQQRGADLIVVGRGRASRFMRAITGSVSDGVVRRGERPILVVPAMHEDVP